MAGSARSPAWRTRSHRTRRGYVITMSYDLLNRLTVRSSPTVTYARDTLYGKVFPGYSTGGLTIAGTTDQFTYDAMGNLTEALNDAADVRRTYGLDGSVRTDTLIISNYGASSPSGSGHRYGLVFRYDRDGRRVWMQYPHNLTWPYSNSYYALHDTAWFDYDSAWGALTAAHDIMGNGFTFSYDAEGRTIGIAEPGGVVERYAYDDDGRLHTSTQTSPFNNANDSGFAGGYIHADTLYYDGRGKLLRSAGHLGEAHEQFYTGLGALAVLRNVTVVTGAGPEIGNSETWQDDALGNNVSWAGFAKDVPPETDYYYQSGTGRLVRSLASGASAQDTTIYDAAGSTLKQYRVNWYTQCSTDPSPCGGQTSQAQVPYQQWVHNYYDGSDRLTVADSRSSIPAIDGYAGGYEEYRYDALGRRVLHRFRSCGNCSSYIDRTVYDGDQYLLEIRREGSDTSQAATLENDSLPDVLAAPYGRVAYLNARGFDKPLDIVRMEYDGDDPLFALVPHENWRGLFDAGTFADGAGRMTGVTVNWQSQNASANYLTTRPYTADWHGSIIQDKREGSGALYMRNRYFDPATGRFTQEDPIGLAGGINLYGFAKGDPVTYSDPFGLCVEKDIDCQNVVRMLREQKGEEFQKAADFYEGMKEGRVYIVAGDDHRLWTNANRDGNPETWKMGTNLGKDIILNGESTKGDFLIAAVHEPLHQQGLSDYSGEGVTIIPHTEWRAYNQLSPADRATAVRTSDKFYHLWGPKYGHHPVPDRYPNQ